MALPPYLPTPLVPEPEATMLARPQRVGFQSCPQLLEAWRQRAEALRPDGLAQNMPPKLIGKVFRNLGGNLRLPAVRCICGSHFCACSRAKVPPDNWSDHYQGPQLPQQLRPKTKHHVIADVVGKLENLIQQRYAPPPELEEGNEEPGDDFKDILGPKAKPTDGDHKGDHKQEALDDGAASARAAVHSDAPELGAFFLGESLFEILFEADLRILSGRFLKPLGAFGGTSCGGLSLVKADLLRNHKIIVTTPPWILLLWAGLKGSVALPERAPQHAELRSLGRTLRN